MEFESLLHDERFIHIFMEFVIGGELHKYLLNVGRLEPYETAFYAAQVLLTLETMHEANLVYRDLKPENILINIDGYL